MRIGARHFETVFSPGHRDGNPAGLSGGKIEHAVGDAARHLDRLITPRAVAAVPLIFRLDREQLPFEPGGGLRFAVGRNHDDIELGDIVVAERFAGEQRLHADHRRVRHDRKRKGPFDGATARLGEAHHDFSLERLGRDRHFAEADFERGLAFGVGLGQIGKRDGLAAGVALIAFAGSIEAERIAGIARPFGSCCDIDLAFNAKPRRRRAIQEAAVERDVDRDTGRNRLCLACEIEFEPVGHIVFDQEARVADCLPLRIGIDGDAPCSGRCRGDDRYVERTSADPFIPHHRAAILDSVRALHHRGQADARNRDARGVAQECRHMDSLAGAIDAALGEHECVEPFRGIAAGHTPVGQIERRLLQA